MIGFYCTTVFQIFLSVLIKRKYFGLDKCIMYLCSRFDSENYNVQSMIDYGFEDVVFVGQNETAEDVTDFFEKLLFFSISCEDPQFVNGLQKKELILVYEGITSFQLRQWSDSYSDLKFDLDNDIDRIWLPSIELLTDKEFIPKVFLFDTSFDDYSQNDLKDICYMLNDFLRFSPIGFVETAVFMDRYLSQLSNGAFISLATERVLTQMIYYSIGEYALIKRHPNDLFYESKYNCISEARVLSENVPWELLYLNAIIEGDDFSVNKYVIYNSFAPANLALLFGNNAYRCICVEPIVERYASFDKSFLNLNKTKEILTRFSQVYNVPIDFIRSPGELYKMEWDENDEIVWERVRKQLIDRQKYDFHGFGLIRSVIDCMKIFFSGKRLKYYINSNNLSAELTRDILKIVVPHYVETSAEESSDFVVDCDGSCVDFTKDVFDVRRISVIEGYYRLSKEEEKYAEKIRGRSHIYIWGGTDTNIRTFEFLSKAGLEDRVEMVFDRSIRGECRGVPIIRFSKEILKPSSIIIVCANIAYIEIEKELLDLGFIMGEDFIRGISIGQRRKKR